MFDRVEIETERGPLVIEAERPAAGAGYIGRMTLGGRPLGKYRLSHDEAARGRTTEIRIEKRQITLDYETDIGLFAGGGSYSRRPARLRSPLRRAISPASWTRRSARAATATSSSGRTCRSAWCRSAPTSIPQEWDWVSGYHRSDSTVIGFSHTHLSGTGIGDLFDVTVMPVVGEVTYARGTEDDPSSGLWSYADRTREIARPGYYSVPLTRYGITAEMTATPRVGLHRYTFPASDAAAVVFDLENGGCWDKATDTGFRFSDDSTRISGWRYSTGWAKDQKVYFVAEFSKPAKGITYLQPGEMDDSKMPGSRPAMRAWISTRRRASNCS